MYRVSIQGVNELTINVHYYCLILSPSASPILPPVTGLLVLVFAGGAGGGGGQRFCLAWKLLTKAA